MDKATDQVLKTLADLREHLDRLPPHGLRQILSMLVARLEVDLETKQLNIELALPNWAAFDAHRYAAALGLKDSSLQTDALQTQGGSTSNITIALASFDCGKPPRNCYECRRRAA